MTHSKRFKKVINVTAIALCTALLMSFSALAVILFSSHALSKADFDLAQIIEDSGAGQSLTNTVSVPASLAFTESGDTKTFSLALSNASTVPLSYHYSISLDADEGNLAESIFVYFDGEYMGTLSRLCETDSVGSVGLGLIIPGKLNQDDGCINAAHTLAFELHIASEDSSYNNKSVGVTVSGVAENADCTEYMFIRNSADFLKALDDINSGLLPADVTVVLCNDIDLTGTAGDTFTFSHPFNIDLWGKKLIFTGKQLAFTGDGTYKLTSSRSMESPAVSAGSFSVNGENTLFVIDDMLTGGINVGRLYGNAVSVVNCDDTAAAEMLVSAIREKISGGIKLNQNSDTTVDLFGALSFYADNANGIVGVVSGDGYTVNGGTLVIPENAVTVTSVTPLSVSYNNGEAVTEIIDCKLVTPGDDAVYADLLANELRHIPTVSEAGVVPTVYSNLFLPVSVPGKNVSIEWTSSLPGTISANGRINDTVRDNQEVTLYANVRVNASVYPTEFTFKVSSQNNETKFSYIVAQLSPLTLETVYNGTNREEALLYLPVVNGGTPFDYREVYQSPTNAVTLRWNGYRDVKLEYMYYKLNNTYDFISMHRSCRYTQGTAPGSFSLTYTDINPADSSAGRYISAVSANSTGVSLAWNYLDDEPAVTVAANAVKTYYDGESTVLHTATDGVYTVTYAPDGETVVSVTDNATGSVAAFDTAIYLNQATFYTYAQIEAYGKFEGDDTVYTGRVNVIIKSGEDSSLFDIVFQYADQNLSNVDILKNILDTRKSDGMANERGDFQIDNRYMTFNISYSPTEASAKVITEIVPDSEGNAVIKINPEGFSTAEMTIPVNVTVSLDEAYRNGSGSYEQTRTLYFKAPPVITVDDLGFSDYSVFSSVKYQIYQQLPDVGPADQSGFVYSAANHTVTNNTGDYILIRDIEYCKELHLFLGNETVTTDCNGVFGLVRLLQWATGDKKVSASSIVAGAGSSLSDGNEYLNPEEVTTVKNYLISQGLSEAYVNTLWASVTAQPDGVVFSDGDAIYGAVNAIISAANTNNADRGLKYFKYIEVLYWATNQKEFANSDINSNVLRYPDTGEVIPNSKRPPNLGTIDSNYNSSQYALVLYEDDTQFITSVEKEALVTFMTKVYTVNSVSFTYGGVTYTGSGGTVYTSVFNAYSFVPTFLDVDAVNKLVYALYKHAGYFNNILDAEKVTHLSGFTAYAHEVTAIPDAANPDKTIVCPHVTNIDGCTTALSYFTSLETFEIVGDRDTNLAAFTLTDSLALFYSRLAAKNTLIKRLTMSYCAGNTNTAFDLSNSFRFGDITYLDLSDNPGITNVNVIVDMDVEHLAYLDIRGCSVTDELKEYCLQTAYAVYYQKNGNDPIIRYTDYTENTDALSYTAGTTHIYSNTNKTYAEALRYLKDTSTIDSVYEQLCKQVTVSDGSKVTVKWRIEDGNMMYGPYSRAGNDDFTEVDSVADMFSYMKNYYYCTSSAGSYTAGHVYRFNGSGNALADTGVTVRGSYDVIPTDPNEIFTADEIAALTGSETETVYSENQPTTPTSTTTYTPTVTTLAASGVSNNTTIYVHDLNGNLSATYSNYRNSWACTNTPNTINQYNSVAYKAIKSGAFSRQYLFYTGSAAQFSLSQNCIAECIYNINVSESNYSADYTVRSVIYNGSISYTFACGRFSFWTTTYNVGPGNDYSSGYLTVGSNTSTSTRYYFGTYEQIKPYINDNTVIGTTYNYAGNSYSSVEAMRTAIENANGYTYVSTTNSSGLESATEYMTNVTAFADTGALDASLAATDAALGKYYRFTGTTATGNYHFANTTATDITYTRNAYYTLSYTGGRITFAPATITTGVATPNMESILAEAQSNVNTELYGNYYGTYFFYSDNTDSTATTTVNGRSYTNNHIYRLMETNGVFYYEDCGTCTSSSNLNADLLYPAFQGEQNEGNIYYYNGPNDLGSRHQGYTFYTITNRSDIGAFYLKTYGALQSAVFSANSDNPTYFINTVANAGESKIKNNRYYFVYDNNNYYYSGTGDPQMATITAVVTVDGVEYIRKFRVTVNG